MKISYKKLWKLLIDREMMKKDLAEKAGISNASIAKLGRNENNQYLSNNFCIDSIEEVEDGYVITVYLLEEKAREVSEAELQSVKDGNEIEFRNQKWKISNSNSTMYDPDVVVENGEKQITIGIPLNPVTVFIIILI